MYGSLFENNQKGKCALCGQEMGWKAMRYGDVDVCFDHSEHELRKIQVNIEHYHTLVLRGYELEKQLKIKTEAVDLDKKLSRLEFLITNNQNEIEKIVRGELRSFEIKNTTGMSNLQVEISSLKSEIGKINQSAESNQAAIISEISEINEIISNQATTTNKILQEVKQAISNNSNSSRLHEIENKLEELEAGTSGLRAYLDEINGGLNSRLDSLYAIKVFEHVREVNAKEPEPLEPEKEAVVKPEMKETKEAIIKAELERPTEITIPEGLKNPVHISVYRQIASIPSTTKEITTALGATDKQKVYDSLKYMKSKGYIVKGQDERYHIP